MQNNQENQSLRVDLTKTTEVKCECGTSIFIPAYIMRKVSKFLTGGTEDVLLPISVMLCMDCGNVLEDTLPGPLKTKLHDEIKAKVVED